MVRAFQFGLMSLMRVVLRSCGLEGSSAFFFRLQLSLALAGTVESLQRACCDDFSALFRVI